jgi:subtilase family protein
LKARFFTHGLLIATPVVVAAGILAACESVDVQLEHSPPADGDDEAVVSQFLAHTPGLDEDVHYALVSRGEGTRKVVIRADGHKQDRIEFDEQERVARVEKMGAMSPQLFAVVRAASPDEAMPIAIYAEIKESMDDIASFGNDESEEHRVAAFRALKGVSERASAPILAAITSMGLAAHAAESMPAVFTRARPEQVWAIARLPGVSHIDWDPAPRAEEYSSGPTNAVTLTHANTGFNQHMPTPYFGTGQKVGIISDKNKCFLFEQHQAFGAGTVTYQSTPPACVGSLCPGSDSACGTYCDTSEGHFLDQGAGLVCVNGHDARAASAIMVNRQDGPWGAARVALYSPNVGDTASSATAIKCSAPDIAAAFSYLVAQGVTTTSESYGCTSGDGLAQDWYARYSNVAAVRAAGNLSSPSAPNPTVDTSKGCRAVNSICVGGTLAGGMGMKSDSAWQNPPSSDREEPDVVALGTSVETLSFSNPPAIPTDKTLWDTTANGTSFAAPAIAGFVALLKQACGGSLDQRYTRSVVRTASFLNVVDGPYSTPGLWSPGIGGDFKDGAGIPLAEKAIRWCPGGGGSGGVVNINLGTGTSVATWVNGSPPADGGKGSSLVSSQLGPLLTLNAGDRARATASWDSCPASAVGTGPSPVTVDFDLFLCSNTKLKCFYSRSFMDNNEGFDVIIPAGMGAADWQIFVGWNPATPYCNSTHTEVVAWSAIAGPPAIF